MSSLVAHHLRLVFTTLDDNVALLYPGDGFCLHCRDTASLTMDSIGKTITVVTDEANRVNAVIVDQGRSILLIDGLWWWSRFYFSCSLQ